MTALDRVARLQEIRLEHDLYPDRDWHHHVGWLLAEIDRLNDEVGRRGEQLHTERQHYRQMRDRREAAIARARQLHAPNRTTEGDAWCDTCERYWPCPTFKALEGKVPDAN